MKKHFALLNESKGWMLKRQNDKTTKRNEMKIKLGNEKTFRFIE